MEVRDWLVDVRGLPRPNEVPLRMDMVNRSEGLWGRSDAAQAVADTAQNGLAWSDTVPTRPYMVRPCAAWSGPESTGR